jgi:hypothetical protein
MTLRREMRVLDTTRASAPASTSAAIAVTMIKTVVLVAISAPQIGRAWVGFTPMRCRLRARGTPRARQQEEESERRHRADRDPKEEQRAGRPREVIAEHGKIGRRVGRHSVAQHANVRDDRATSKTVNPTMTSIRTPLIG